jgi:tetratricopeptide (TPR) repeat protein/tRNA A-37 threonylcarbamoyl transferase component Bud32
VEERLAAFAAGACVAEETTSIGMHVDTCARCSAWLHEAKADDGWVDAVRGALAAGTRLPAAPAAPRSGDVIAGYRLVRELGEGGMGIVYEAEQDSPKRRVALKLIRPGLASRRTLRRFEHEAEVLGRLQHPGIAQIFAAGTFDSGHGSQPFFAMELVAGRSLLQHAVAAGLGVRARLALFVAVCEAVHHAHQKGILHRDLKPSNVLVDERGQPKVLDFGVARVLEAGVERGTLDTLSGQMVGTLPYMSPEQVSGSADLDLRSDVYTLGVVLYELLTGRLPYRPHGEAMHERARAILEQPPLPLAATDRGLGGDLETIVGTALEKDRERRYASAAALADDVRRYLADEPIAARPPSGLYVLGKLARRHKAAVAAFGAVAVVLVAAVAVALRLMARAQDAEGAAKTRLAMVEKEAGKFREVNRLLQEILSAADPFSSGKKEPTIREALDAAARRLERRPIAEPEIEAALQLTLGEAYHGLGQRARAEQHLERSVALHRGLPEAAADGLLQAMHHLARARMQRGAFEEGELLLREALDRCRAQPVPAVTLAKHLGLLGTLLFSRGDLDEAEPLFTEAAAVAAGTGDDTAQAFAKVCLADLHVARGEVERAGPLLREALAAQRRVRGDQHPDVPKTLDRLAYVARVRDELTEAEAMVRESIAIRREVLGEEHPDYATSLGKLGELLVERGDAAAAEPPFRQALSILRAAFGERDVRATSVADGLSYALVDLGRLEEAEALRREVLEVRDERFGRSNPDAVMALRRLAEILVRTGRAAEAERMLADRLAVVIPLWTGPDDARPLAQLRLARGTALVALHRASDAEAGMSASFAVIEAQLGAGHPITREAARRMAELYAALGRGDDAGRYRAIADGDGAPPR